MTPLILYPNAVSSLNKFMVCRVSDGAIVQGEHTETHADHAVKVLDDHNMRNGHAERYTVKTRAECRL